MPTLSNGSIDYFSSDRVTLSDPANRAVAVVPHDTNALAEIPRGLFVGTGGNITLRGIGNTSTDTVWKNVPSGSTLPIRAQYIRSTGTTATDILALY